MTIPGKGLFLPLWLKILFLPKNPHKYKKSSKKCNHFYWQEFLEKN